MVEAGVDRRSIALPSWVFFGMILLAAFAACVTVTMRTRSEHSAAVNQHRELSTAVETLRGSNAQLSTEIRKLRTDPRTIEAAARARLSMVRPNEIVVPVE